MDQSLVQTFSWANSYGPMVLKVLLKFPPTLVLVHGWLFLAIQKLIQWNNGTRPLPNRAPSKKGRSLTSEIRPNGL